MRPASTKSISETMPAMRNTPPTSENEMAANPLAITEEDLAGDSNSKNDHGNQPDSMSPSVQSAASLDFFSTPELLEMALLPLPPSDIISAMGVSVQTKKTIDGSIKLQHAIFRAPDHRPVVGTAVVRHNPLDHFIAPFSSDAEYAKLCYPPHEGPLLRANPFIFDSAHDLSMTGLLPLSGLVDDLINTSAEVSPTLGDMFISQPPIRRVKLELRCVPVCHYYEVVLKDWELVVDEGIKVEDLVAFGRQRIPERGGEEGWLVRVQLGHGYEAVEERKE